MKSSIEADSILTHQEIKRYSRQLILPSVGIGGQEKLKKSRVLVVGAGGLGSPVITYLAAAGIGKLGVADFDYVELSNLHRQYLHTTSDIGSHKLWSSKNKIEAINPNIQFVPHEIKISKENVQAILSDYDVVVDGTDNFQTRYCVNDACVVLKKPLIYGSVFRFEGLVSVFAPHLGGPCYRCLYPVPAAKDLIPSCSEAGVFGTVCGIVGSLQASEAIKIILGIGKPLLGRLLVCDSLDMSFDTIDFERDIVCPVCSGSDSVKKSNCEIKLSCESGEKKMINSDDITVEEVSSLMKAGEDFIFVDVRNLGEREICKIEGTRLIPIQEIQSRLSELPKEQLIVLHCHHGGRSRRAMEFLKTQGYTKVKNLEGGIDRWADVVDPSMPKY